MKLLKVLLIFRLVSVMWILMLVKQSILPDTAVIRMVI